MLKIGLTGGIGCGKSTAAALFTNYNTPVIDADVIAHQLTQSGQKAVAEIVQAFGTVIMKADGSLNRAQLRELIFSDAAKKHQLEAILHPLIFAQMQAQVDLLDSAYCILCIPLLIEKHRIDFVDRVLVVDCPEALQLERVKRRDHLTLAQIQSIIATQATRNQRLSVADEIIDNSKPAVQLAEQVKKLHNLYLNLSST